MLGSKKREQFSLQVLQICDAVILWGSFFVASLFRDLVRGPDAEGYGMSSVVWLLYIIVPFTPLVLEIFGFYDSPDSGITDQLRSYSGDMAPRPMLKELMRIGAVVESENGNFKVLRRDFIPEALSAELVERLGEVTHNFFSTAARNIEKKGPDGGLFERIVFAENGVTDQAVGLFDAFVKHRGQEFLEELDNWLVAREKEEKGVGSQEASAEKDS